MSDPFEQIAAAVAQAELEARKSPGFLHADTCDPGFLYAADCERIDSAIWCDCISGIVYQIAHDSKGRTLLDRENLESVKLLRRYKAPLRFRSINEPLPFGLDTHEPA